MEVYLPYALFPPSLRIKFFFSTHRFDLGFDIGVSKGVRYCHRLRQLHSGCDSPDDNNRWPLLPRSAVIGPFSSHLTIGRPE